MKRNCDNCSKEYEADQRNINRGWGLCCSKSCAASKREKGKPGYNPARVAYNNILREKLHNDIDPQFGKFTGRYTTEGYKVYGKTAINEWGEPMYDLDLLTTSKTG